MSPAPAPSWWRTVALLAVAVMLPLAALTAVAVRESARAVERQATARALDSAVTAADAVDRQVEALGSLLAGYAHNPLLQGAVADPQGRSSGRILANVTQTLSDALPGSAGAVLADADGLLLRSWPHRPETTGTDFSGRDWFRGAVASGTTHASDGYVTRAPGSPAAVAVSVPLRDGREPGAPLLGVLAITLRLDALSESLAATAPSGGRLLVTDADGRLLAAPHRDDVALQDEAGDPHVRAALAGERGAVQAGEWLEAYAPSSWGWTVRTQLPASTASTETAALRRTVLLAAGAVAAVVAGALALLARALRRRQADEARLAAVTEQLEDRQRFTGTLLEAMDVGVLACDRDLRVTYANGSATRVLGAADGASGTVAEVFAGLTASSPQGEPVPLEVLPVLRAVQTGRPASAQLLLAGSGRPDLHLLVRSRPLLDAHGEVAGAVSVAQDVTPLHEREQALAAARDDALAAASAKTAFLASVSHEIRTPLNGVLGMLELLLLHPLQDEQRDRAVVALDSGRTLLRLLTDVLDLSKGDAGRLQVNVRVHDPADLLRTAVAVFAGAAQRKGLALELHDDGLPPQVRVDGERLTQVVLNLVGNAVKFTEQGRVQVRARLREGALVVEVSDTGPGIAPDEQQRLFRPFEQGEAGRRTGGTGLGLALVRQVVELLDGSVDVRSELAEGSRFTVRLPVEVVAGGTVPAAAPAALPAPRPAEQAPPQGLDGLRVLVAEDNPVNQMVLRQQLEQLGAQVQVVGDGAQAVAAARAGSADVVVLDWQMPVMDGLEAAALLRADARTAHLRLVGLTARTFPEDVAACRAAGMDLVLSKPCSAEELLAALDPQDRAATHA